MTPTLPIRAQTNPRLSPEPTPGLQPRTTTPDHSPCPQPASTPPATPSAHIARTPKTPAPNASRPAPPLTFGRDHHLRRKIFVEASFEHKARINLYWLAWLLDRYTDPGQIVLDPMGGAGSILLATTKNRLVITGDVESHWAKLQAQNVRRSRNTQLFVAPALACQWDAARLPLASGLVPAIVTSPPYFDMFSNWNRSSGLHLDGRHVGPTGNCYGFSGRQLGNIHIYENYLRAMRKVYCECWRVLRPGGYLVLIVGDRVRRKRRVPITADTEALCVANGFRLVDKHERAMIPSHFRNIHAKNNGGSYPSIEVETALVFQKGICPDDRTPFRLAIVQAPRPNSSSGQQLFAKQLAYTQATSDQVLVLTKEGLVLLEQAKTSFGVCDQVTKAGFDVGQQSSLVWSGDHRPARRRKVWAFGIVRDLVAKHGLGAGVQVELHVSLGYARYLQQRLNTVGAMATIPTARHNLGEKLAWYTEALVPGRNRLSSLDAQNAVSSGDQPEDELLKQTT